MGLLLRSSGWVQNLFNISDRGFFRPQSTLLSIYVKGQPWVSKSALWPERTESEKSQQKLSKSVLLQSQNMVGYKYGIVSIELS